MAGHCYYSCFVVYYQLVSYGMSGEQMLPTANGREKTCHFVFLCTPVCGAVLLRRLAVWENEPETNGRRSVLNGRADY